MKRCLVLAILILCSLFASAQSMKVVVDSRGEVVGQYLSTKGKYYVVLVQDTCTVPIAGHRVVTFSAVNGQGVVYRKFERTGNINVRKGPGTDYPVIAKIKDYGFPDGYPDTFDCLGKIDGWFKIRINGKVGYVREDMAEWSALGF